MVSFPGVTLSLPGSLVTFHIWVLRLGGEEEVWEELLPWAWPCVAGVRGDQRFTGQLHGPLSSGEVLSIFKFSVSAPSLLTYLPFLLLLCF